VEKIKNVVARKRAQILRIEIHFVPDELAARVPDLHARRWLLEKIPVRRPLQSTSLPQRHPFREIYKPCHEGKPVVLIRRVGIGDHTMPGRSTIGFRGVAVGARSYFSEEAEIDVLALMHTCCRVFGTAQFFYVLLVIERQKVHLNPNITECDLMTRWRAEFDLTIQSWWPHLSPRRQRRSFQFGKSVSCDQPSRLAQSVARARRLLHSVTPEAPEHGAGLPATDRSANDIDFSI